MVVATGEVVVYSRPMVLRLVAQAALLLVSYLLVACDSSDGNRDDSSSDDTFDVQLQRVFPNLDFSLPVAMMQAPADPSRFYVVEKGGSVRAFASDTATTTSSAFFTDSNSVVDDGPNEAGLLGMAFHPNYANNATVYLSYTRDGSPLVSYVSRFTVVNGSIDANTEQAVLTVDQPYTNHNGGQITFGPDGYLYIGLGDGGSGGDPDNNGQDTHTLLGALLRIDVDGGAPYAIPADNPFAASTGCGNGGGCPELFAWGLRNPWRWSFDRNNGELWLADVGQNAWEEVNRVRNGENYGWRIREGAHCFNPSSGCETAGLVDPVAEYDHDLGNSITGGYVYRGDAIAQLQGYYLYGDFGSGRIWALDAESDDAQPVLLMNTDLGISSFAEDSEGEVYVLDYRSGGIHKLVPAP